MVKFFADSGAALETDLGNLRIGGYLPKQELFALTLPWAIAGSSPLFTFLTQCHKLWLLVMTIIFQEYTNHQILGKMAGLRITKNKWVKYDSKWVADGDADGVDEGDADGVDDGDADGGDGGDEDEDNMPKV